MKVSCDECKESFEIKIKEEKVKGEIRRAFFKCPSCGKKYISYYSNDKIKKLQEQSRDLLNKMCSLDLSIKEFDKLFNKRKKVIIETKKEMERLKNIYGSN